MQPCHGLKSRSVQRNLRTHVPETFEVAQRNWPTSCSVAVKMRASPSPVATPGHKLCVTVAQWRILNVGHAHVYRLRLVQTGKMVMEKGTTDAKAMTFIVGRTMVEDPVLAECRDYTQSALNKASPMLLSPDVGQFLKTVAALTNAKVANANHSSTSAAFHR